MEKKNWIIRTQCPYDGRHTKVALSPLGISKLTEASNMVESTTSKIVKLSQQEAEQLNLLLEKMRGE